METDNDSSLIIPSVLPDGNGGYLPCPTLLTEAELIQFLRIPEIGKAKDVRTTIANLKRYHNLPSIHISRQPLYPVDAIKKWIQGRVEKELK